MARLRATGVPLPDAPAVHYAVDFLRLLVQVAVPTAEVMSERRSPLAEVIARRTALSPAAARELVRVVEAPEFRSGLAPRDLIAFIARFGKAAGEALVATESADVDLASFGRQYGGDKALLLLDSMFAVLTTDEDVDRDELRRLEDTATALGIDAVLFTALLQKHDRDLARGNWEVTIKTATVTLGRSLSCEVLLPDPQVAGIHATLSFSDAGWRVQDAKSGRPTVVNGRPVNAAPVGPDDELRVGPFVIRVDGEGKQVTVAASRAFATLSVSHLTRTIGKISLLDDTSFTVFSGVVVAMIGPSGCGKTTLLNAIAGVTPADTGTVRLDGRDYHGELRAERESVGIVPQDDIVHPELTVEESLYFGAKLRLPVGTGDDAVNTEVARVLEELGIEHIRGSRIGDALRRGISGGQRKRVNLGQELLARSTRVLFLDEPTSGLDPRASQDIVRLVRQIADRGRIVFVVTHDLSPQVVAQVDHLLVLAPGGRVAFFGPPAEAVRYFGVDTPDAIFNQFAGRDPRELGEVWKASSEARTYVAMREQLLKLRMDEGRVPPAPATVAKRRSGWAQVATLVRRYSRVKARDLGGLAVLMLQAPVLALVMKIVFPHPTKEMLFMLSLSCLWFGMSASVRELISDRVIWLRERRIGVRPAPYVWSKTYVLGALVGVQCAGFAALNLLLHSEFLGSYGVDGWLFTAVCAVTGFVGMALGLAVSAVNTSSEGAVGTLPLLLIPQIAFSGILLSLRRMSEVASELSSWNPARFAYDALIKTGERIGEPASRGLGWDERPLTGTLYNLGFKGDGADDLGLSMQALWLRLALFASAFLLVALAAVYRRRE